MGGRDEVSNYFLPHSHDVGKQSTFPVSSYRFSSAQKNLPGAAVASP